MSLYQLLFSLFFLLKFVYGTHWRFGQISWKLVSGKTVEFTAQLGWRSTSIGSVSFAFGDGTSISLSSSACSTGSTPCPSDSTSRIYHEVLSTTTDLSGEGSTLIKYIFYHTYSSDGPHTYGFSSCCRIGGLLVGSQGSYIYYGNVDLTNGNTGSPVSALSPIVQFPNGVETTFYLLPVDNDGDTVTCRAATESESGIIPNGTYALTPWFTVDETDCTITIDELANIGDKWAAQVIMETNAGDTVPIDFLFEAADPSLSAPVCSLVTPFNSDDGYQVSIGNTLIVELSGTDDDSSNINVQSVTLPNGATISPTGSNAVPVSIYLNWTPAAGNEGSFSASVQLSDSDGLTDLCIIPIVVTDGSNETPSPTSQPSENPTPNPTGNPTPQPTPNPSSQPTPSPTPNPSGNPTPSPTPSPSPNPTPLPTLSPTEDDFCGVLNCPIECDTDPCNCVGIGGGSSPPVGQCIMTTCHSNGCDQCIDGYFKANYSYPCVSCQETFGDACKHCTDFLGCQQCVSDDEYDLVRDPQCGLHYCRPKDNCGESSSESSESSSSDEVPTTSSGGKGSSSSSSDEEEPTTTANSGGEGGSHTTTSQGGGEGGSHTTTFNGGGEGGSHTTTFNGGGEGGSHTTTFNGGGEGGSHTTTSEGGGEGGSDTPAPSRSPTEEPTDRPTGGSSDDTPCEYGYFEVEWYTSASGYTYDYLEGIYTDSGDDTSEGTPIYINNDGTTFYQDSSGNYVFSSPDSEDDTWFILANNGDLDLIDVAGENIYTAVGAFEDDVTIDIIAYNCDGTEYNTDCEMDCIQVSGMNVDDTTNLGSTLDILPGGTNAFDGTYCYNDECDSTLSEYDTASPCYERVNMYGDSYDAHLSVSDSGQITFSYYSAMFDYTASYSSDFGNDDDFACQTVIDEFFDDTALTGQWDYQSHDLEFEDLGDDHENVNIDPSFTFEDCVGADFYCDVNVSGQRSKYNNIPSMIFIICGLLFTWAAM